MDVAPVQLPLEILRQIVYELYSILQSESQTRRRLILFQCSQVNKLWYREIYPKIFEVLDVALLITLQKRQNCQEVGSLVKVLDFTAQDRIPSTLFLPLVSFLSYCICIKELKLRANKHYTPLHRLLPSPQQVESVTLEDYSLKSIFAIFQTFLKLKSLNLIQDDQLGVHSMHWVYCQPTMYPSDLKVIEIQSNHYVMTSLDNLLITPRSESKCRLESFILGRPHFMTKAFLQSPIFSTLKRLSVSFPPSHTQTESEFIRSIDGLRFLENLQIFHIGKLDISVSLARQTVVLFPRLDLLHLSLLRRANQKVIDVLPDISPLTRVQDEKQFEIWLVSDKVFCYGRLDNL